MGGIRLFIPSWIPVLYELVKGIVLLQTHSQNLWGFKTGHAAKEKHFPPQAVCSLGVLHTVKLWCNPWTRKECSQSIFLHWNQKPKFQGSIVGLKKPQQSDQTATVFLFPWASPLLCCFIWPLCPDTAAWNKQDSSSENIPLQSFLNVTQLIFFYCCCYFLTSISMLADVQNIDKVPLRIPSILYSLKKRIL